MADTDLHAHIHSQSYGFSSPGDLPKPGIKLVSPVSPALAGWFFTTSSTWNALFNEDYWKKKKSHSVCVYSNGEKTMYVCWCSVAKSCRTLCYPWTAACQVSLSFSSSWSLLKFTSIESMMLSNHLICHRLLLLPSICPSIRVFHPLIIVCQALW